MKVTATIEAHRAGRVDVERFEHKFFTVDSALEFLQEAIKGWIVTKIEITVAT